MRTPLCYGIGDWDIYPAIERIERLVKDGVLKIHDFTNFSTYVDCIKGKQTNMTTKDAKRSSKILEILHTNICGPFSTPCLNSQRYFIYFIKGKIKLKKKKKNLSNYQSFAI
jgi:hypothetical protein